MATYAVTDTQLKNIADKIRSKLGTSDLIGVDDMPAEIEKISGGGAGVEFDFTDIPGNIAEFGGVTATITATQYEKYYGYYLFKTGSTTQYWWTNGGDKVTIDFSRVTKIKHIYWPENLSKSDKKTAINMDASGDGETFAYFRTINVGDDIDINQNFKAIRFRPISGWSGFNNLRLKVESIPSE